MQEKQQQSGFYEVELQGLRKVKLPNSYIPCESEEYMNDMQLAFFKVKLLDWKKRLIEENDKTISYLKNGDDIDLDSQSLKLRISDRVRKLIYKIDSALHRIETDEYGFCEESGEPIGVNRLIARPVATLCIEMQEMHEEKEDDKEYAEHCHSVLVSESEDD